MCQIWVEAKGTTRSFVDSVRSAWASAGRLAFELGFACFIYKRRPEVRFAPQIEAKRRPIAPPANRSRPFAHTVHPR